MSISKDLFLAILAMDSYNRGYGAGITGLSEVSDGTTKIGTATVSKNIQDAGISAEAQAAGFYAISYDTEYGKVISYRGTDKAGSVLPSGGIPGNADELFFTDFLLTRFDDFDETSVHLASRFYNAVKASTTGPINTTGHSLGGALAGFVGAMNGVSITRSNPCK